MTSRDECSPFGSNDDGSPNGSRLEPRSALYPISFQLGTEPWESAAWAGHAGYGWRPLRNADADLAAELIAAEAGVSGPRCSLMGTG
jgi:hypothetical protein